MFQANVMKERPRWFRLLWVPAIALAVLSGLGFVATAADKKAAEKEIKETTKAVGTEYLSVGDKVRITYSDTPVPVPPTEQQIPETKMITLHLGLEVQFVGKTKTELEKEIHNLYIEKGYYKNIGIVIDVPVRMISVGGEVRNNSTFAHQANLTLTKVINAAGGFTEYAKKRKIQITRADGKVIYANWHDAVKDPQKDPLIHPGDRVQVDRSIF